MDLVITGGLRLPGDFAKALAMGADAVAIASAALVAAACQQYRICNTGQCPVGVATQDEELRKRLHIDHSAKRLCNYLNVCRSELEMFGRITGHANIHDLSVSDLSNFFKSFKGQKRDCRQLNIFFSWCDRPILFKRILI